VDEAGCPTDTDGDGVLDNLDACPGTAPGTVVDATGCEPAGDTDGDGINDTLDRCPNTAPGQNVDAVGCPVLFLVEQGQRRPLVLQGVAFASGRSVLTEDSYTTLDEVAASLAAHPEIRIEIAGHTDATGSDGGRGVWSRSAHRRQRDAGRARQKPSRRAIDHRRGTVDPSI